jgi:hypothetical protein
VQISAGEKQQPSRFQNDELREQEHRSDQIVDDKCRLIACNESRNLRQRHSGKRHDADKEQRGNSNHGQCDLAVATSGGKR